MPNFIKQLALVSETASIDLAEMTRVAAALDRQGTRDFAPIWSIYSSVHAFARLEDVPLGYWPMVIRDDIDFQGAAGIHLDKDGQPFALITSGASWPLTASHEMLEMLADPFGNRTIPGASIKPGQGRVNYLVEVCDPSEAAQFAYSVNDVEVSDFYTPAYFDPVVATGVRYSFTGAIKKPREVLKGGYLSWHEPVSDHWFQARFFGSTLQFKDIGRMNAKKGSLRSQIDAVTMKETLKALKPEKTALTAAAERSSLGAESSVARAKSLTSQMDAVVKKARKANLSS
jgi:hypothetical protein